MACDTFDPSMHSSWHWWACGESRTGTACCASSTDLESPSGMSWASPQGRPKSGFVSADLFAGAIAASKKQILFMLVHFAQEF